MSLVSHKKFALPPIFFTLRTHATLQRANLLLISTVIAVFSSNAMAQNVDTVMIGKVSKKSIGTITSMNSGDVACYVTLKDDKGVKFEEMADFDICEREKSLKGKRLQLTYAQANVMAQSCQGNVDCKKTDKVILIEKVKLLDTKSPASITTSDKQSSFCTPMEQVVFTCRTGAKMVSVCASKDASRSKGYMQYRFGKPDSTEPLEMTLPEGQILPSKAATGDNLPYAGGGASWLRFSKGDYNYVVYTGIGKWGPKGQTQEKQGLLVERSGKRIAQLKCSNTPDSELGPDFFEKMKINGGNYEFDMPD